MEALGFFGAVFKWCHPILPVLSNVRTYDDEPGGIALVQRDNNIYIYLWVCAFNCLKVVSACFSCSEWCMRCMFDDEKGKCSNC